MSEPVNPTPLDIVKKDIRRDAHHAAEQILQSAKEVKARLDVLITALEPKPDGEPVAWYTAREDAIEVYVRESSPFHQYGSELDIALGKLVALRQVWTELEWLEKQLTEHAK